MEFFSKLIIRIPSLPFSKLLLGNAYSWDVIKTNQYFAKSLFLANPTVYEEFTKWKNGKKFDPKKETRLKKTLIHYWLRMHSNPTPFGLFAKISTAEWANDTKIQLGKEKYFVRLDMEVLHYLAKCFNDISAVKEKVRFYPNNTIYKIADKIRYNEIESINNRIFYKLSEIEIDLYIDSILNYADEGKTITEICQFIFDDNYDYEDFENLIQEMIDSSLLISELQINITGTDSLKYIKSILESLIKDESNINIQQLINFIENVEMSLYNIQHNNDSFEKLFNQLFHLIKDVYPDANPKKLIQVDLVSTNYVSTIDKRLQENLLKSVKILTFLSSSPTLSRLEKFKRKFAERYETAFLPLMEVLDSEYGIGFGDFSFIADNIFIEEMRIEYEEFPESKDIEVHTFLLKKYIECIKNNSQVITVLDSDIEMISSKEENLGNTFQLIFSFVNKKTDLVSIITVGNSSAGNLISRFSHTSNEIQNIVKEITEFEDNYYDGNAIVAEIAHIPEYRIGNIAFRTITRDYEIPIVTHSVLKKEQQIAISDIYVGVRQNRIVLLSKKLKKEIKPKLTNAHNYGKNTLPIYQFLSEISYQNTIPSLRIEEKGELVNLYKFFPRIQYKNIILSKAYWLFNIEDFQNLYENNNELKEDIIGKFIQKWKLSDITSYNNGNGHGGDNEMFVIWNVAESVQNFLITIKGWKTIILTEYLFDNEFAPIKDHNGNSFNNQIISFIKNTGSNKNIYNISSFFEFSNEKRVFHLGDEWIYFKIYCGRKYYEKLLINGIIPLVETLKKQSLIDLFFFLPFDDTDFHLRIRFHCNNSEFSYSIIEAFITSLEHLNKGNELYKIMADSYYRELERYGGNTMFRAEIIFSIDSNFILDNYEFFLKNQYFIPLLAINQIKKILDSVGLNLMEKHEFIMARFNAYSHEFNIIHKNDLKVQVDKKLNEVRKVIKEMIDNEDFLFLERDHLFLKYEKSVTDYVKSLRVFFQENMDEFENKTFLFDFLASIIHMHCIRVFPSNPRQNELFVYGGLYNYYKSQYYLRISKND